MEDARSGLFMTTKKGALRQKKQRAFNYHTTVFNGSLKNSNFFLLVF